MKTSINQESIQLSSWFQEEPFFAISAVVTALALLFFLTHNVIAHGLIQLARHTQTKIDDILVKHLKPKRISWLAPVIAVYLLAYLLPEYQTHIQNGALFIILWITALTLLSLFDAINEIYESRPGFNGVSIESFLDIGKILIILLAIILASPCFPGSLPLCS